LFLFAGCAACESLEEKEQKYEKGPPVIEKPYASKAMRKDDTWRIYLRAFDPIASGVDSGDEKKVEKEYTGHGGDRVPRSPLTTGTDPSE